MPMSFIKCPRKSKAKIAFGLRQTFKGRLRWALLNTRDGCRFVPLTPFGIGFNRISSCRCISYIPALSLTVCSYPSFIETLKCKKCPQAIDRTCIFCYNRCRWFGSGEMAEWFKALVLKTSDVARHRGFESLSLRQFG